LEQASSKSGTFGLVSTRQFCVSAL
jgi:hypothetical protein